MSHSHSHIEETPSGCSCSHNHSHSNSDSNKLKTYSLPIISFILLAIGLILDHFVKPTFFSGIIRLSWYLVAYLIVGLPVIKEALQTIRHKDFFNEFTLMVIATIGAFLIREYAEAVAVMLFYAVGELFQDAAVNKAKNNIKALLDIRPDSANVVLDDNKTIIKKPEDVEIGNVIRVKAGEKVPLDGDILSNESSFNTSALTGESKPRTLRIGEPVLAGMINIDRVIDVKVTRIYEDSSLAKILDMVQNATSRKSKTELLIHKFAKIYTPIVFLLAVLITIIPYFFVDNYVFTDWLYRALVFLVISCPCALVISIPLGYFGGIGAASRNGILFKGANYMDIMSRVNTVVMDKTGTLTQGIFEVQQIHSEQISQTEFISILAAIENHSNHPIAKAIVAYSNLHLSNNNNLVVDNITEISGYGLEGYIDGKYILAGNSKLLKRNNISYDKTIDTLVDTIVILAINNTYSGYITIADKEKEDAITAIQEMNKLGIKKTVMLSGDKDSITQKIKDKLHIKEAYGDLLPENKVKYIENLKKDPSKIIAFVGDGINDAPSLALSDVGIAMGGMGSDAAIEVADVIIQTDQPSKIPLAIKIAKCTRTIVLQNIILAFSIKLLVMILGAEGVASMWEAVFADVGVALLAILNSVRILNKKF